MNNDVVLNDMTVTLYSQFPTVDISNLLAHFGLIVTETNLLSIPGSYWGESEAGLIKNVLYVRKDTPLHSLLHEACHYICMDDDRRIKLDTDAGGDYDEENAVCYLQILLSDHISNYNRQTLLNDMDTWGYTFRLGSAKRWFDNDAEDAKIWLIRNKIINQSEQIYQLI